MDFLRANVQLATPFHSLLRVRHSTDRRTDTRRPLVHNAPSLWGRGRHKSHNNAAAVRMTHIWTCVSCLFTLHILLMFFSHSFINHLHSFIQSFSHISHSGRSITDRPDSLSTVSFFFSREKLSCCSASLVHVLWWIHSSILDIGAVNSQWAKDPIRSSYSSTNLQPSTFIYFLANRSL